MLRIAACLLCATLLPLAALADEEVVLAQASADLPPAGDAPADRPAAGPSPGSPLGSHGGEVITLEDAVSRAFSASPRLGQAAAAQAASRGTRLQAGLRVNPEIGVETQNFAGRGQYRGFNSAETFVGVSQLVELGGKRAARVGLAEQGVALAGFDSRAARLDLRRDVERAFVDVEAAQERVKLAAEQKSLAKEVYDTVRRRVSAAREPQIQQSKAGLTLSSAGIGVEQARMNLTAAREALAALWGGGDAAFTVDGADFFRVTKPPSLGSALEASRDNPDVARFDAEVSRSKAALELERANAVPDPRVAGGVRDFRNGGAQALVVNFSIPIPVANGNQGNIERARQEIVRSEAGRRTAELATGAELARSQAELEAAYLQAVSLRGEMLPGAKKAFALARQGYETGRFAYLEVLDAQRTLHDLRSQYLEALRAYHRGRADVARLTAPREPDEPQGVSRDE